MYKEFPHGLVLHFECSIFICIHLAVAEYIQATGIKKKQYSEVKETQILEFCYSAVQCTQNFISIYYIVNSLEVCRSCHSQYILILPCNLSGSTSMSIEVLIVEVEMLYEIQAVILLTVVMCRNNNICSCFIVFANNVTLYRMNLIYLIIGRFVIQRSAVYFCVIFGTLYCYEVYTVLLHCI